MKKFLCMLFLCTINFSFYGYSKNFFEKKIKPQMNLYFENREFEPNYQRDETLIGGRVSLFYDVFFRKHSSRWFIGYTLHKDFGERHPKEGSQFILDTLPESSGTSARYLKPKELMAPEDSTWLLGYELSLGDESFFRLGDFSRPKLHSFLWDPKLSYYRPFAEGMDIQFLGSSHIFLDWLSRQTLTKREGFLIGSIWEHSMGALLKGRHEGLLHHNATTFEQHEPIWDNVGVRSTLSFFPFAEGSEKGLWEFFLGSQWSWLRLRSDEEELKAFSRFGKGAFGGFGFQWMDFSMMIRSEHSQNGQYVRLGDGFQQATSYQRADFCYGLKSSKKEILEFQWNIHHVLGVWSFGWVVEASIDLGV